MPRTVNFTFTQQIFFPYFFGRALAQAEVPEAGIEPVSQPWLALTAVATAAP